MSLLSEADIEAELARLRRYREAHCEDEFEFGELSEPLTEHAWMRWSPIVVGIAVSLPIWGAVGLIAVLALR